MANQARATLTNADSVFIGSARCPQYNGGLRGIELTHLVAKNKGTIDTLDADGVMVAVTATQAITNFLTTLATGVLVSGAVATFDVGRSPTILATADVSATPLTFIGTDDLGRAVKQTHIGPTTSATATLRVPMKTITSISCTGAPAVAITIGMGNTFNFDFRIPDTGAVSSVSADGKPETTLTIVAGLSTATTPTATTADTRGTWTPNTSPNGTIAWNVLAIVNHTDDALAFGTEPFAG